MNSLSLAQRRVLSWMRSGFVLLGRLRPHTDGKRRWFIAATRTAPILHEVMASTVRSLERLGFIQCLDPQAVTWREYRLTPTP